MMGAQMTKKQSVCSQLPIEITILHSIFFNYIHSIFHFFPILIISGNFISEPLGTDKFRQKQNFHQFKTKRSQHQFKNTLLKSCTSINHDAKYRVLLIFLSLTCIKVNTTFSLVSTVTHIHIYILSVSVDYGSCALDDVSSSASIDKLI